MKKDKLIQEFEGLRIENANGIIGGDCVHPTEDRQWVKTTNPNNPNDFHMDEVVVYWADADEGDTLTLRQLCTPLNL